MSFAALIEEKLDQPVTLEVGRRGQFEVVVDGTTVVSRQGGLLAKLTGRPWPTSEDVLQAVRGAIVGPVG